MNLFGEYGSATWLVLALCSALFSAGAAVTQKRVLFRVNALEFSFLLSFIIMVFSTFIPLSVDVMAISAPTALIILGKSLLGGMAFLFVMKALERNQISTALPLLGLTPAVAALFAMFILGEMLQGLEWVGVALMMIGVYMLEKRPVEQTPDVHARAGAPIQHRYILGAVGLFGVSSVFDKMLVGTLTIDARVVLFYQHIVYWFLFGAMLLVRRSPFTDVVRKGRELLPLLVLVAVLTIVYRFTQLEAMKLAPVAMVLAVKRTSILFASFFGGKLFSDDRLGIRLAGAALIVAAGFLILRNVA